MRRLWALPFVALVAGCGPIPVAQAERICIDDARAARAPTGEIGIGVGTGGARSRVKVAVSSDFLLGRDPSDVFDRCVYQRSGQPPSRPLAQQPGWRG